MARTPSTGSKVSKTSIMRKVLSTAMAVVLAVGLVPFPAFAEAGSASGVVGLNVAPLGIGALGLGASSADSSFTYTKDDENQTATITGYSGTPSGALSIPGVVTEGEVEYRVTAIAANAFKDKTGFTGALSIPSTVTGIGASAFEGCKNLTGNLVLPSGLTSLGEAAFKDCDYLTGTVAIPAGITTIPDKCFYISSTSHYSGWPGGLSGVTFAEGSKLESVGAYAFAGNYQNFTGGIKFPDTVKTIGERAFYDTGGSYASGWDSIHYGGNGHEGALTLPADIESIGDYAFYICNFSGGLVIPNATVAIGKYAFFDAGFYGGTLVIPDGTASISDHCFGWNHFEGTLNLPKSLKTIGNDAFQRCEGFSLPLVIPEGVETIGSNAFTEFGVASGTKGTLTLPNTLKTIGESAFYYSRNFEGPLVIPDSVESIGESAFNACPYFTSLKLPENEKFTTIEEGAFGCTWSNYTMHFAGELKIPESVTSIGAEAFRRCSQFTGDLKIPSGVKFIGRYAFSDCWGFTGKLELPGGLTSLGSYAFQSCSGFTSLGEIPSGVTAIGDYAFSMCEGMTGDLVIPGTVKTIGRDAFNQYGYKAEATGALIISEGVTDIGYNAFKSCKNFTGALELPPTITTLGDNAFQSCTGFTKLELPSGLASIPSNFVAYCTGLTGELSIPSSVKSIGGSAFSGCTGLTGELSLPSGLTTIDNSAFKDCAGFTGALTIPDGVTKIDSEAFENCTGFDGALTLPSKLSTLGYYAFKGCTNLTGDVTIPSSLTSLNSELFDGCAGLTGTLTIPASVTSAYASASYGYTFSNTYFSTIVNNSSCTFDGAAMLPSGVCACYVDSTGAKAATLGTGTYMRKAYDNPIDISGAKISGINATYAYTGNNITPEPVVTLNGKTLVKGEHYTVTYGDNRYNNRTATVYVRGYAYNGYKGEVKTTFKIASATPSTTDLATATVAVAAQTYTGAALTPAPTVKVGSTTLVKDKHYTVSYKNNVNAGTATVTVTGVSSAGYTGAKSATFQVKPKAVTPTVTLSATSFVYDGAAKKPGVTVKDGAAVIPASSYTVSYSSNVNAGEARVAVSLKGNYSGSGGAGFTIKQAASSLKLVAQTKAYTGKALAYSGKVTKTGSTGAVAYAYYSDAKCMKAVKATSVKNPGVYYVKGTVAAKGNYAAATSAAVKLTVNPKGTAISKVTGGKKAFTAVWKKQAAQTSGYQVQYAPNKKFTSAKTVTVKSVKTVSKKVAKLKAKKKYWVRVRTYKAVGKTTYYSSWSASKTVTTKK